MFVAELERRVAQLEEQLSEAQSGQSSRHLQSGLTTEDQTDINNFFILICATLVFYMQAGFVLLELGMVARNNTKNILVKNVFVAAIGALCWWACGFVFAFGHGDTYANSGKNGFAGTEGFFFEFNGPSTKRSYYLQGKSIWFFQWTFAGTATTIVSGSVAERCSFIAYLVYAVVLTSLVYPFVAHMNWSADGKFSPFRNDRLFGSCGVIDFGGSATVHMTGGIASLVGPYFVGPREGRFDPSWVAPEPHPVYPSLGVFVLWLGWYAFNGGSMLAIVGYSGVVAHIMMTTTIAAASGCLSTTLIGYLNSRIVDVNCVNNGLLAGLVSITSGCASTSPSGALIIGLIGGPVYYYADIATIKILKVDDVVSAFSVHGACGIWGVIAASLFATPYYYGLAYSHSRKNRCAGVFYGGNPSGSFMAAIVVTFVVISWTGSTMGITFFILRKLNIHRISIDDERAGRGASKRGGALRSSFYEQDINKLRKPSPVIISKKIHPKPQSDDNDNVELIECLDEEVLPPSS